MRTPKTVEVPLTWAADADGFNTPTSSTHLSVVIDPNLEPRGEVRHVPYGPTPAIFLREWDERVFLHEVLHALLGPALLRLRDDPDSWAPDDSFHNIVTRAEVGILAAGFRYATTKEGDDA